MVGDRCGLLGSGSRSDWSGWGGLRVGAVVGRVGGYLIPGPVLRRVPVDIGSKDIEVEGLS